MKLTIFSDSHGVKLESLNLPKADVYICCGDFSTAGELVDTVVFLEEFGKLHGKKLLISGNHDWLSYRDPSLFLELTKEHGIIYLQDSGVTIKGVKFYGTPWSKEFNDWAFMKCERDLETVFKQIPFDVNVLISHSPPYGLGDSLENPHRLLGSKALRMRVEQLPELKLNCYGHIHSAHGGYRDRGCDFINASVLDEAYSVAYPPTSVEI